MTNYEVRGILESEGSSEMEENQNIRMRKKTNSSMWTVSKQKDVMMSSGNSGIWCVLVMMKYFLIYRDKKEEVKSI